MTGIVIYWVGVVNELAEERLARESAAISAENISAEELAQITRRIIESRDIKALIKSAANAEDKLTDTGILLSHT